MKKAAKTEIPRKTVYRLSVYLRCLQRLKSNQIQTVSSEALARAADLSDGLCVVKTSFDRDPRSPELAPARPFAALFNVLLCRPLIFSLEFGSLHSLSLLV